MLGLGLAFDDLVAEMLFCIRGCAKERGEKRGVLRSRKGWCTKFVNSAADSPPPTIPLPTK